MAEPVVARRQKLLTAIRRKLYQVDMAAVKQVAASLELDKEECLDLEGETMTTDVIIAAVEAKMEKSLKEEDKGITLLTFTFGCLLEQEIDFEQTPETRGDVSVSTTRSWRKDFKIHGQIGDAEGNIGYMSFLRQVMVAEEKGHTESEIISGVIQAISPSARVRGYLEGRHDLTLPILQTIIRTFYQEKTATELYQDLCTLVQGQKETVQDFVFRALELQQKILFSSREDGSSSYNDVLVSKQFRQAVSTGIREEAIKLEIHQALESSANDEALLKTVNDITKRHMERQNKIGKVDVKSASSSTTGISENVLKELQALRVEVKQLKSLQGNLNKSGDVNTTDKPSQSSQRTPAGQRPKRARGCDTCQSSGQGSRCSHCYKCGGDGHYRRNCRASGNAEGSLQ